MMALRSQKTNALADGLIEEISPVSDETEPKTLQNNKGDQQRKKT